MTRIRYEELGGKTLLIVHEITGEARYYEEGLLFYGQDSNNFNDIGRTGGFGSLSVAVVAAGKSIAKKTLAPKRIVQIECALKGVRR